MTVLPETGASAFDRMLVSLFLAIFLTGFMAMLIGYEALPRQILKKIK
ncbi:MAG: hypothetical protein HY506_02175 [Candidatus Yanofskybacteria bacterium]|nr:hypothetical protein [Candidatus Yanofskybacteria bacterium]